MDNKEITALAREYAEEATKADASDPNLSESDLIEIRHDIEEYVTGVLRFLFRRYYLVEKEAVRKGYEPVKDTPEECNYEELGATWDEWPYLSRFYDKGYKLGLKETIEPLFLHLGKEVEG